MLGPIPTWANRPCWGRPEHFP